MDSPRRHCHTCLLVPSMTLLDTLLALWQEMATTIRGVAPVNRPDCGSLPGPSEQACYFNTITKRDKVCHRLDLFFNYLLWSHCIHRISIERILKHKPSYKKCILLGSCLFISWTGLWPKGKDNTSCYI